MLEWCTGIIFYNFNQIRRNDEILIMTWIKQLQYFKRALVPLKDTAYKRNRKSYKKTGTLATVQYPIDEIQEIHFTWSKLL